MLIAFQVSVFAFIYIFLEESPSSSDILAWADKRNFEW